MEQETYKIMEYSRVREMLAACTSSLIGRDRAQKDRIAAKVVDLQPGTFQQVDVGQQRRLLLGRELHHHRFQQQLAGHIAVGRGQLFKELALVGRVFINDATSSPRSARM